MGLKATPLLHTMRARRLAFQTRCLGSLGSVDCWLEQRQVRSQRRVQADPSASPDWLVGWSFIERSSGLGIVKSLGTPKMEISTWKTLLLSY